MNLPQFSSRSVWGMWSFLLCFSELFKKSCCITCKCGTMRNKRKLPNACLAASAAALLLFSFTRGFPLVMSTDRMHITRYQVVWLQLTGISHPSSVYLNPTLLLIRILPVRVVLFLVRSYQQWVYTIEKHSHSSVFCFDFHKWNMEETKNGSEPSLGNGLKYREHYIRHAPLSRVVRGLLANKVLRLAEMSTHTPTHSKHKGSQKCEKNRQFANGVLDSSYRWR